MFMNMLSLNQLFQINDLFLAYKLLGYFRTQLKKRYLLGKGILSWTGLTGGSVAKFCESNSAAKAIWLHIRKVNPSFQLDSTILCKLLQAYVPTLSIFVVDANKMKKLVELWKRPYIFFLNQVLTIEPWLKLIAIVQNLVIVCK